MLLVYEISEKMSNDCINWPCFMQFSRIYFQIKSLQL